MSAYTMPTIRELQAKLESISETNEPDSLITSIHSDEFKNRSKFKNNNDFEPATNMCPDCEGEGGDCETCYGIGEIFESEDDDYGAAAELQEIREQIMELCQQALRLVPRSSYESARAYWYGHIMSACGSDEYHSGSATSMADTIRELGGDDDGEDEDDGSWAAAARANGIR